MMYDPKDRESTSSPESTDSAPTPDPKPARAESPRTKRNKIKRKKAISLQIMLVSLLLVVVFLIGLLIPLRPKVSDIENRTLTKFPKMTLSGILDGSFFSEVELWYADTFPMREFLLSLDGSFEALFGMNEEQIIGAPTASDEIPTVTTDKGGFDWMQLPPSASTGDGEPPTENPDPSETSPPDDPNDVPDDPSDVPVDPPKGNDQTIGEAERHGSIYLVDDTAYELYGFVRESTDDYIEMINKLAKDLDGKATVYPIVAPLSYSVNLSRANQEKLGLTDQNEALVYIYSSLDDRVKKVYTYANLLAHNDEYLYFRTDHHWTSLGAYYAYEVFCAQKGIAPNPLSSFKKHTYDGFLGTLYGSSGSPAAMQNNPDTVVAYQPSSTNSITCYQSNGEQLDWSIITNVETWKANAKYSTFIGGDNPYSEIRNPNKSDGSACVVVKNSYGNAFVPFLVDHYEYVYVIDFRYYDEWSAKYKDGLTFTELIDEKNVQDVLIVTNIMATGSNSQLSAMSNLFTK